MSRWEGFNLPLAEMQWSGRPVLAFNLGAHPEVTADPWLLCDSVGEMADKAVHLLERRQPPHILAENRFEQFRDRHRWQDVIERYLQIIESLAQGAAAGPTRAAPPRRVLLVDCTNAAVDPANPGVIRVTRRLGHALQQDSELLPIFARWNTETCDLSPVERGGADDTRELRRAIGRRSPACSARRAKGSGRSTTCSPSSTAGRRQVLFLPEVVLDGSSRSGLRGRGPVACWLRPLYRSHSCYASTFLFAFSGRSLSRISGRAGGDGCCLCDFAREPAPVRALSCASQSALSAAAGRSLAARPVRCSRAPACRRHPPAGTPLFALCVSSIDPRKNHRNLIEAFRALLSVGRICRCNSCSSVTVSTERTIWLIGFGDNPRRNTHHMAGLVSDDQLAALFERAAFSVFPSLVEGYGLPVVESLWMGRPCLCHSDGVMAELAAGGGCLTVDMSDAASHRTWPGAACGDAGFRVRLTEQVLGRMLSDWASYGAEISRCLRTLGRGMVICRLPHVARLLDDAAVPVLSCCAVG